MMKFRELYNHSNFNNFTEFIYKNYKAELIVSAVDSYVIIRDEEHIHEMKVFIDLNNEKAAECTNIINYIMIMKNTADSLLTNIDDYYETELTVPVATRKGIISKVKRHDETVTYTRRTYDYNTYDTMLHDSLLNYYTTPYTL